MATLDTRAVWPVRVHKLFTWLDATSDNLPVFRWRVAGPPPLTVRYRTFVGAVAGQPWTELPVTAGGRVDLPVSYATFGAALVQHGPDAVHGAEVEVVDGEGGRVVREVSLQVETLSPPVWVGGCAPTLTPASLRLGFSAGARTALEAAQVRWDLGLRSGSLAPLGPVRLQWGRSFVVGAEITALGEEKWAPLAYTPELPSQRCRTPWGFDPVFHGVDAGPGMGLCAWGPYPAETLDAFVAGRDGRLSQTSAIAGVFDVLRASTPLAPDGQGRFSLEPSTAYGVTVSAEQPSLRLPDGGPYTWPTQITVPEGYVSTVQAQGRARYPVAAFERRGREHRSRVTEGRPFVTRTFVQRVQVDVPPLQAEAELPTLGIEVPVTFDAACSAPLILEVQL